MKCKHYKGEGYSFEMIDEDINICEDCYFILASEVAKQMVIDIMANRVKIDLHTKRGKEKEDVSKSRRT